MHPLSRLFTYARAYRRDISLATVYSVLNKIFDVLPELLIGVAVDVVVNRKESFVARLGVVDPLEQLIWLAIITVVIWLCESAFEYLYEVKWRNLAQNLQHDLRMDAYAHVQRLELAYFERNRTGNLLAILNEDVNQMERFLNGGANDLIQVFVGSLMVGAVFFFLSPTLALLALLPVPLILCGAFWFQSRLAPRYAAMRESAGAMAARLNNNLQGIATVKASRRRIRVSTSPILARIPCAQQDAIRGLRRSRRDRVASAASPSRCYIGMLGCAGLGRKLFGARLLTSAAWPLTRLAELTACISARWRNRAVITC